MPSSPASPLHFRGARLLFVSACLVVVIAGLDAAEPFLVPFLMALFLTVLCVPSLRWLRRSGLPDWAAASLVIIGATLVVLAVVIVIGGTVQRFYEELPFYRARLNGIMQGSLAWLSQHGLDVPAEALSSRINAGALMDLAGGVAGSLVSAFSNLVIILLVTAFMLFEVFGLPEKLRQAIGDPAADLADLSLGVRQVQRYLAIKTVMSLLNAGFAIAICAALGVDFPLLWGLIAFLFNYVPNIGSILASIPPVSLALVQYGPARAATVAMLYLLMNLLVGYLLEPRLMGRRLGLSPVVVILSLLFWGWLWGPLGVLLAVPLTSALKILLEHSDDFRWAAMLIGNGNGSPPPPSPGATIPPA
jgi:predicted PurR-regulated permease PerM